MAVLLGHQIGEKLIKGLGLPKQTRSFVLRCESNEVVSVTCEYFPEGEEWLEPLINEYQLTSVGGTIRAKPVEAMHFDSWYRAQRNKAHAAFMARDKELSHMDRRLFCHG